MMLMPEFNLRVLVYFDLLSMSNGVDPESPPEISPASDSGATRKVSRTEFLQILMKEQEKKKD